jgi:Skp family chaperone for outer membrane proteins
VHGINGAGASTSFNSMWAERWRELEELEVRRRQALDKQMQEAKLKLEAEMNRAKMEQEILSKRRQIEQQQAELHQLQQMYGNRTEPEDRVPESRNDCVTRSSGQPPQNVTVSDIAEQNTMHSDSFQLQHG